MSTEHSHKKRKMEDGSISQEEESKLDSNQTNTNEDRDEEMDETGTANQENATQPVVKGPPLSSEEFSQLLTHLPSTLSLLSTLHTHGDTAKRTEFKELRKSVLRLAAQLQDQRFDGETKDAQQKRAHRRKEKAAYLARELKMKSEDAKYINSVALRNSRIQALNAMMEPNGSGEKSGDKLLLPGESSAMKLLMPSPSPTSSASSDEPSTSPVPVSSAIANLVPNQFTPTAAVLAAAAGPQSYTYPTIAPTSQLAELVSATTSSGSSTKPFVRTGGVATTPTTASETTSTSSILVPALPIDDDDSSSNKQLSKNQQRKKAASESTRQQKKAAFGQEGVHVNKEVLKESLAKEKESQQLLLKQEESTSVPMDTTSSSDPIASAAAAAQQSDPVSGSINPNGQPEFGPILNNPRSCYCCKARFYQLHFFYSEFCANCARLNYAKRNQLADLRGKVVLLTGSRVKIGFRCGLRLLRCGALLIATSRFPHDTAKRYAEEKDFNVWKDRLHIYGLDLRDLKSVVKLSEILSQRYERLDAIINNAAQTVRRPPMYYRHLLPIECLKKEEMPLGWQEVVKGDLHQLAGRKRLQEEGAKENKRLAAEIAEAVSGTSNIGVTVEDISHLISDPPSALDATVAASAETTSSPEPIVTHPTTATTTASSSSTAPTAPLSPSPDANGVDVFHQSDDLNAALLTTSNRAAALSQLEVLPGDQHQDSALFPANRFDVTGQQLDLRPVNSWNLTLDQVDPSELVEVFAINALSPFILNSRLKGLMLKGGAHPHLPSVQTCDKYIINVSAMEGKFYRHKSPYHPHTNAAKAALNMLTRTSAQDYARERIYMNSVDTGWINDENPYETAKRLYEQQNFQTPIDEEDAMARILDPLLSGVNTGINPFGKFFKDYHETEW